MTAKHSGVAKMWLLNLFGNAALLAAVYGWLVLPDAHGWQVAGSGLLAVAFLFFGLWLRAGTFAYFRVAQFRNSATVWKAFRHGFGHIVALAIWAIPLFALEWFLFSLLRYTPQFGVWFWQKSPSLLHFGSPRQVYHVAGWLLWFLMLIVLPAIWLPIGMTVVAGGFRGGAMARSLRVWKRIGFWAWFCVLILAGAYIPYRLVWWIPDLSSLRRQAWSAGLRFVAAYLILITAFIALLLVVGERVEKEDPTAIT